MKENNPFILTKNIREKTIPAMIQAFEDVNERRIHKRADQTVAFHTILSWATKDAELLTDRKLKAMAQEFMRLRGDNLLFAISKHVDRSHVHLHIAVSGTQLNGQSSRISQKDFSNLKLAMDRFQKDRFPELEHSLPEHGKGVKKSYKFDERLTVKNQLHQSIADVFSKSTSTTDFKSKLHKLNIQTYDRGGELMGIVSNDLKFRFSRLGISLDALKELDAKLAEKEKNLKEIQHLRGRKAKEMERQKQVTEVLKETSTKTNGQTVLQELSDLRAAGDKDLDTEQVAAEENADDTFDEIENKVEDTDRDADDLDNEQQLEIS